MPSHVTLLGPFVETQSFDRVVEQGLQQALGDFRAFEFLLLEPARFDKGVLYLTVDAVEPFRALIRRLCNAFPEFRPFGEFTPDEVIPHLTIATGEGFPNGPTTRDREVFERSEAELAGSLPIVCRAKRVAVMADGPSGWTIASEIELG